MKIIGRSSTGFIVEMTTDDVAAIVGERWYNRETAHTLSKLGVLDREGHIRVGAEIDMAGRFARTKQLDANAAELAEQAKRLRMLADVMDAFNRNPIINPAKEAQS